MITIDGWITIGTKLNTDKFERQITELENKIDSEGKKQANLNSETQEYEKDLAKVNQQLSAMQRDYDEAINKAKELNRAMKGTEKGTPERKQLTNEFYQQQALVGELGRYIRTAENKQAGLQNKVNRTKLQYENSVKAVDKLRGKIEQINMTKMNAGVKQLTDGIGSAIKKVGKLALAVLSVRSAYMLLRQASSTWGQYNEQYARDLEYIRFALASGLAPILEKIVNLVATLMTYVNYLSNMWFGKMIFASAKDFEKMSKSAGGVAKATKEIKNNIASFDELSILSKSSSGGAGGGFLSPSFDLGDIGDVKIPEWLQWLGEHGKEAGDALGIIAGAIGAMKLSELATNLGLIGEKLAPIKALGIGLAIHGIVDGVADLQKYAEDPTLENLGTTISDIGEAVVGVGLATGNLPIIVGGALVYLAGAFVENWDTIKQEMQSGIDWLREKAPEIEKIFGKTGRKIYDDTVDTTQDMLDDVDYKMGLFNSNMQHYIALFNAMADEDWATAWNRFQRIFVNTWDAIANSITTGVNAVIRGLNWLIEGAEKYINELIDMANKVELPGFQTGNINHVSFNTIPLLGKQNFMPTNTIGDLGITMHDLGIQGPIDQADFGDFYTAGKEKAQNIVINFEGTMSQLVREMKPELDAESKRAGVKLIQEGGAY